MVAVRHEESVFICFLHWLGTSRPPEMNKCNAVGRLHQQNRLQKTLLIA